MPKEYIEREAALSFLKDSLRFCKNELDVGEYRKGCIAAIKDDIGNIKHIPAADVVEVVRCKDCKHRGNDDICPMIKIKMCNDGDGYFDEVSEDETFDDGFCSYGERKEEN